MIRHVYFMLALLCFFSFSVMNASGFDGSTLVTTTSGRLKFIKELQVGDEVISYNNELQQEVNFIKGVCFHGRCNNAYYNSR